MKISELARAGGIPVATVKFYLREGLLSPGTALSRTSASYDQSHLERLKLLRALREVGKVSIARLREVVGLLDRPEVELMTLIATGADALNADTSGTGDVDERPERVAADSIVARAGWNNVRPNAPDRRRLADLLEVISAFGTHEGRMDVLQGYVEAADRIGRGDIANLDAGQSPPDLLSEIVIGQVIFGELLLALRRLAEEHYVFERFGQEMRARLDSA